MVAHAIPEPREFATKSDIADVKADIAEIKISIERLGTKMSDIRADLMRWMLVFFVPLWLGTYGTLAAIVVGFASGR